MMFSAVSVARHVQDVEGTMSVSREDLSLKMWQLQEAVQRLRINVRTVHDTKCRLFSAAWRKVSTTPYTHVMCALHGR